MTFMERACVITFVVTAAAIVLLIFGVSLGADDDEVARVSEVVARSWADRVGVEGASLVPLRCRRGSCRIEACP